jgi:hypothetical protein
VRDLDGGFPRARNPPVDPAPANSPYCSTALTLQAIEIQISAELDSAFAHESRCVASPDGPAERSDTIWVGPASLLTLIAGRASTMKTTQLIVVCLLLGPSCAHADLVVEQEVTGHATRTPGGGSQAATANILLIEAKGDKVRTTLTPIGKEQLARRTYIVNAAKGEVITLMPDRKRYQVTRADAFEQMKPMLIHSLESTWGPIPVAPPVARPTGRKKSINGFDTEEYVSESSHLRLVYWIAPSLRKYVPEFARMLAASAGSSRPR